MTSKSSGASERYLERISKAYNLGYASSSYTTMLGRFNVMAILINEMCESEHLYGPDKLEFLNPGNVFGIGMFSLSNVILCISKLGPSIEIENPV